MYGQKMTDEERKAYIEESVRIWLDNPEMDFVDLALRRNQVPRTTLRKVLKERDLIDREKKIDNTKLKTPEKFPPKLY